MNLLHGNKGQRIDMNKTVKCPHCNEKIYLWTMAGIMGVMKDEDK